MKLDLKSILIFVNLVFFKEQIQKIEEKRKNQPDENLDILVDKLETLEFEKAKVTETEVEIEQKENYFKKISTKSVLKTEKKIDLEKLSDIKAKIKENMNKQCKYKESKEIPVDEAFKLLKDHEKRIQVINYFFYIRFFFILT